MRLDATLLQQARIKSMQPLGAAPANISPTEKHHQYGSTSTTLPAS